jgi:hypothetical protein
MSVLQLRDGDHIPDDLLPWMKEAGSRSDWAELRRLVKLSHHRESTPSGNFRAEHF